MNIKQYTRNNRFHGVAIETNVMKTILLEIIMF